MSRSGPTVTTLSSPDDAGQLDLNLRELLDHIAVELAHEYIRLMESAAGIESEKDQEYNR